MVCCYWLAHDHLLSEWGLLQQFSKHLYCGKILLTNDLFMMEAIHGAITGRQSLITRIGTLSIPGALLSSGIDFTIYSTKEHSTGSKVN